MHRRAYNAPYEADYWRELDRRLSVEEAAVLNRVVAALQLFSDKSLMTPKGGRCQHTAQTDTPHTVCL